MLRVGLNSINRISTHRTPVGLVLIGVVGFLGFAFVAALAQFFMTQPAVPQIVYQLLAGLAGLILIVTVVQAATYALAELALTTDHIEIANWSTVFSSKVAMADFGDIVDVTVSQGSILARIFGYGTLLVQTAGTRTSLELTYVPNVYPWRDTIAERARASQPR